MLREIRYLPGKLAVEKRAAMPADGEGEGDAPLPTIVGHAAVFDTLADIGPSDRPYWRERVAKGAFTRAIQEDDVRCLFNHNESLLLGRTASGTLRLSEDDTGLRYELDPAPTDCGEDVVTLVQRGDLSQSSYQFIATKVQWETGPDGIEIRTILEVELYDVSPVTFPAFPTTDVALQEARKAGLIPARPPLATNVAGFEARARIAAIG